jgi:hypothetical protein
LAETVICDDSFGIEIEKIVNSVRKLSWIARKNRVPDARQDTSLLVEYSKHSYVEPTVLLISCVELRFRNDSGLLSFLGNARQIWRLILSLLGYDCIYFPF